MNYKFKVTETATQALASAALAYTYTFAKDGYLDGVEAHFSGACSQTLTIVRDSLDGAAYDTTRVSQALGGVTDYTYQPTRRIYFRKGDILTIGITKGGTTTAGVTVFLELEETHG